MNSRDAAYDDELLRRVIEASKEDAAPDTAESTSRRAKRGRSDSEESVAQMHCKLDTSLTHRRHSTSVKRQRTGSRSVSPPAEQLDTNGGDGTDDEANIRHEGKKLRNIRHQYEKPEKEEKERQRQEAANKRKGRAERRRAEGERENEIPSAEKLTWTSSQTQTFRRKSLSQPRKAYRLRALSHPTQPNLPHRCRLRAHHRRATQQLPPPTKELQEAITRKAKGGTNTQRTETWTMKNHQLGPCLETFKRTGTRPQATPNHRPVITSTDRREDKPWRTR